MARRSHLRDMGCIACKELEKLGSGKEGWLTNEHDLFVALEQDSVALAGRSFVVIVDWNDSPPITIRPSLSLSVEGEITAIEWLILENFRFLAVGTSNGFFLIYSMSGVLIHKQMVHTSRITMIRVQAIDGNSPNNPSANEVCLVMPGIIARFDGSDVQSLLERRSRTMQLGRTVNDHSGDSEDKLLHQLWNVGKYGPCVDAAITGLMPPPLLELQSRQRYYSAIAIGHDAVISAFRISEDRSRSIVGAILSKVVPATFSTLTYLPKKIWRGSQEAAKPAEFKPQAFSKSSVLTCLKDQPRRAERLAVSPSGTLVAITDSLGRILLLDTQALVVVRLWKGYRDACCLFMEMLLGEKPSSKSPYYGTSKSDYSLCLAIHAPRKGIVEVQEHIEGRHPEKEVFIFTSIKGNELLKLKGKRFSNPVWKMRIGPRLLSIQCSKGSKMLQPVLKLEPPSPTSAYKPLEVFLLNGDSGQISVLNKSIH